MTVAVEIHAYGPDLSYYIPAIHGLAGFFFICILLVSLFKLRFAVRKDIPGNVRAIGILRWPTLNLGVGVLSLTLGLAITVSDVWYLFYVMAEPIERGRAAGTKIQSIGPYGLLNCMHGLYGGVCLFTAGFVQYGLFSCLAKKSRKSKIAGPELE